MAAVPLPTIGEVVSGKYRIDSVIGEGGMGVVLGAFDTSLGRPVAIKFLTPARALNAAAAVRFGREARAAASIQSEHVVRVYEVGELPSGAPYIVMEHLKGSDLAHVVEARGGLPIEEAADLLLQACEALGEAHARGIVHRDLKPQNLFLTQRNDGAPCLKVLDFGISKSADADESSPKLTSTDMVMGTPLYMSPEQVRSLKNVDARADIWALGAILHELLTASPPFDGPTASALHAAIAMDPPTPLRTRRPDAPVELEAVIARCLEKKPADRFQDVGALGAALAPFATERGRTAAGRISNVVRAASSSSVATVTPSADQPTLPLGMASTMRAPSTPTDAAWEQKRLTPAVDPRPATAPRFRAGMIAAAVLLIGSAGFGGYAIAKRAPTTPAAPAPPEAPPSAVTHLPSATPTAAPPPLVSATEVTATRSHKKAVMERAAGKVPALADKPGKAEFERAAATDKADERAGKRQTDDALCRADRARLHEFPLNRQTNAESNRAHHCQGEGSSACQLEACLEACQILNDYTCVADVQRIQRLQR